MMLRFLLILILASQTACLCPIKSEAVSEKHTLDCDTDFFQDLSGSLYKVTRFQGDSKKEHWVTLRFTKTCDVLYNEDLSPMGIRSFSIKNPRARSGPVLLMRIDQVDMAQKPIICSVPLLANQPMHLICPVMGGEISYLLEPMD